MCLNQRHLPQHFSNVSSTKNKRVLTQAGLTTNDLKRFGICNQTHRRSKHQIFNGSSVVTLNYSFGQKERLELLTYQIGQRTGCCLQVLHQCHPEVNTSFQQYFYIVLIHRFPIEIGASQESQGLHRHPQMIFQIRHASLSLGYQGLLTKCESCESCTRSHRVEQDCHHPKKFHCNTS